MTRHLDPDRSPPPRFWPFPIDIDTSVCSRCSAMIPATDKAQEIHAGHHREIDWLTARTGTIPSTAQLSDPGSRTATPAGATADASPGSASTSEPGGGAGANSASPLLAPGSDPNVPTPEQEATAGRSGVADTHQGTDAADLLPGSVTPPVAVFPPAATGTNLVSREEMLKEWEPLADSVPEELGGNLRVGRGSGDPGEHHGSAPADTTSGDAP